MAEASFFFIRTAYLSRELGKIYHKLRKNQKAKEYFRYGYYLLRKYAPSEEQERINHLNVAQKGGYFNIVYST